MLNTRIAISYTVKRPSDTPANELTDDGHYTNRKDKRVNRRATPTKKLVFDKEYLILEQDSTRISSGGGGFSHDIQLLK
jgi:hypothetical protein